MAAKTLACLPGWAGKLTQILVVTLALTGLVAGAARAAPARHAPEALPSAGVLGSRPATPAPAKCFMPGTLVCASSDPDVSFRLFSNGDTTGCEFRGDVKWGDGTKSSKPFSG